MLQLRLSLYVIVINILICCIAAKPCIRKYYGEDSFVCVCNATYCDTIDMFNDEDLENESFIHYESNIKQKRLYLSKGKFSTQAPQNFFYQLWNFINPANFFTFLPTCGSFTIDHSKMYQEIFGFGGSITDSVGYLLTTLPQEAQDEILRQYFGDEGLNYTFIRIPLGCSDYSPRLYTYDDYGEGKSLDKFNLTDEDFNYKIPYIKQIQNISSAPIKIITAPWIAPQRMIECRHLPCSDSLKKLKTDYYPTYAKYMIKFLDAYNEEGIEIWGLSVQNEPETALQGKPEIVNLGWTPREQAEWISIHLGPHLNANGYSGVKLLIFDDNRKLITTYPNIIMENASEYVSGIAVHSYFDRTVPPFILTQIHIQFPNIFILSTEFCIMEKQSVNKTIKLGNWQYLELYVNDILEDFNNHVNGWIDWNILVNDVGGPSFTNNTVNAPIIVNNSGKEYYKQPMWYGITHVSRFVPPGSRRIDLQGPALISGIVHAAFETPQNRVVIIMLNRRMTSYVANINVGKGNSIKLEMVPQSVHTIIYNKM